VRGQQTGARSADQAAAHALTVSAPLASTIAAMLQHRRTAGGVWVCQSGHVDGLQRKSDEPAPHTHCQLGRALTKTTFCGGEAIDQVGAQLQHATRKPSCMPGTAGSCGIPKHHRVIGYHEGRARRCATCERSSETLYSVTNIPSLIVRRPIDAADGPIINHRVMGVAKSDVGPFIARYILGPGACAAA
jgi:hypothetical protein